MTEIQIQAITSAYTILKQLESQMARLEMLNEDTKNSIEYITKELASIVGEYEITKKTGEPQ